MSLVESGILGLLKNAADEGDGSEGAAYDKPRKVLSGLLRAPEGSLFKGFKAELPWLITAINSESTPDELKQAWKYIEELKELPIDENHLAFFTDADFYSKCHGQMND
eukprot:7189924-Pyramimonas_sp.AAC.1